MCCFRRGLPTKRTLSLWRPRVPSCRTSRKSQVSEALCRSRPAEVREEVREYGYDWGCGEAGKVRGGRVAETTASQDRFGRDEREDSNREVEWLRGQWNDPADRISEEGFVVRKSGSQWGEVLEGYQRSCRTAHRRMVGKKRRDHPRARAQVPRGEDGQRRRWKAAEGTSKAYSRTAEGEARGEALAEAVAEEGVNQPTRLVRIDWYIQSFDYYCIFLEKTLEKARRHLIRELLPAGQPFPELLRA